jgi:excisionase family DNA binding protein
MLAEQYKRIADAVDAAMSEQLKPEVKPTPRAAKPVSPVATTQRLLSVKDFGALLGVSLWTVRGWAYKGRVASVKLGARMMIPTSELDRLITENLRPTVSREH